MGIAKAINQSKKHTKILIGIITGLLIGGSSTAAVLASVPDNTTGVIHACYKTDTPNKGQVRLIDPTTDSCSSDEGAVSWNSDSSGHLVADLQGADFSNLSFPYRDFSGANLTNVTFASTELRGATFKGATFTNANFNGGTYAWADFSHANLSTMMIQPGNAFDHIDFTDDDFSHAVSGGAFYITNSNLSGVRLTRNDSFDTDTLYLQNDIATNADFSGSHFTNSDFTGTDLTPVDLTNVSWDNTICPDGTNSNDNGNTCVGHLSPQ